MKKHIFIILISIVLYSFVFADETDAYLIVPGVRIGSITEKTTELELIELYGVENVRSTSVSNDKQEKITETILFPFDTMKQLHILWNNGNSNEGPAIVRIESPNTYWHTEEGITLGVSLIELEIMNGTYFFLTEFNLERPSVITDCGYGKLKVLGYRIQNQDTIQNRLLIVSLDQPHDIFQRITDKEYASISTEGIYRSDTPAMELLNPIIRRIDVVFTKK